MLWEHRSLVIVVVLAALIVGFGAGVKIAELRDQSRINITLESSKPAALSTDKSPQISKNFYKPAAPTSIQKPAPKKTPPSISSDGISADAYIVGDLATGDVFMERNADAVLPFASMSKLITALVAMNIYSSSTPITITPGDADVPPDISHIGAGETYTAGELLYPLLMASSNVAAEALATADASSTRGDFLKLMIGYSWEIGMPHAYFADPSGIDKLNSGTARGFLAMAQYLYKSRPDILAITRIATTTFASTTDHGAHEVVNIHPFVSDPRFLGGKTGHTNAALYTMLTILRISGEPVAFIVLRSEDRAKDTNLLIDKLAKQGMKPVASIDPTGPDGN